MQWEQVLAIIGANLAMMLPMFFWLRSEANADRRESANDRRDILQLIINIQEEIKDFHGRLCSIEERAKGNK